MPRDGFEIYNIPSGTHGEPDTTIESARYNAFVDDIALDLNAPRPILSGGTGADDAIEAMENLSGEIAKQLISNFDADILKAGSFYSTTSASGAPVATHAFSGWIYVTDANNMVIQARDNSDTMTPGRLYVREKRVGVWSGWKKDGTTIVGDAEGIASEAGDMFFGIKGVAPNSRFIVNSKADVTGTDILSAPKAGGLTVNGTTSVEGEIRVGPSTAAPGVIRFGNVSTNFLWYNGTRWSLGGGTGLDVPVEVVSTKHALNASNYAVTDGTNNILRSGNAIYFQVTSGGTWGYVSAGGLTMSVGSITTPGNITASGSITSASSLVTQNGVHYLNAANTRYLQWTSDYYVFAGAHVYSAAGRLWGSGDFGIPVSNGRLAMAADAFVNAFGITEPYNGACMTGFGYQSSATQARFRYMQLYTTGWFTCGYV